MNSGIQKLLIMNYYFLVGTGVSVDYYPTWFYPELNCTDEDIMNYTFYSTLNELHCNSTEEKIFLCGVLKLLNYSKDMEDYFRYYNIDNYNYNGSYMNDMYGICDSTMYSIDCG